jgi:hypothetical protein
MAQDLGVVVFFNHKAPSTEKKGRRSESRKQQIMGSAAFL